MDAEQREGAPPVLRCAACGGVIGVYEPVVHVVDGIAHKTSRAADPEVSHAAPGRCFHLTCSKLDPGDFAAVQ